MLALREEVDRLQALVEDTVRWLRFSGHPVKAALLAKELNKTSEPERETLRNGLRIRKTGDRR